MHLYIIPTFPSILEHLYECLPILKKCTNVTPENLISSMVREVGRVMECPPLKTPTYVYPDISELGVIESINVQSPSF